MKYYVIAGEVSGDKHTALVIRNIKKEDAKAEFRGFGGEDMKKEGTTLVRHIKDLAYMGFVEVAMHLKTVLGNLSFCKQDILSYKPDAVILTDYPGFNLRIAKFAHKHNIKVFYYVSPQVWAWKKNRVKTIRKVIDKLFVILPFEKDFYKKHNIEVEYYGNPLLDEISEFKQREENKQQFLEQLNSGDKPIVALLPGSRSQEIKKMLPEQIKLFDKYKDKFDFVIAGVNTFKEDFYRKILGNREIKIVFNNTYNLLNVSSFAIVCSGTATLETALFNVPQMVCYKANFLSYFIATYIVKIKHISLVNIIMKKEVVRELLQNECNENSLLQELEKLLYNKDYIAQMQEDYRALDNLLGSAGTSEKIAKYIVKSL
ncbi:MAG: lipid-A-disaccharide synthase [Bacteroidota bacterium]|nr:lipid-A-disaccharide synthase [Bacteroidota bacterium]